MARVKERFIERFNEDEMAYCNDCGRFISPSDLDYQEEMLYHSEVDSRCYEPKRAAHCPYCDSEEIDDAILCEECGEVWITPDVASEQDGLCDDCWEVFNGQV